MTEKSKECTTKQGEKTLRRSESDKLIRHFQTDQTLSYGSDGYVDQKGSFRLV